MTTVPDGKKLQRGDQYRRLVIGGVECVGWGLGVPACLMCAASALRNGLSWNVPLAVVVSATALCLVAAVTAGEIARQTYQCASGAYHEIVGEVANESVNQIPEDRVLLRGSELPATPSVTLLRATGKGEEVKAEELLRVVSGSVEEHGQ